MDWPDGAEPSFRRQPRRCRAKSASKLVPRCGYSLEGLPVRHRCPECAFEYDEWTFALSGISRGTSSVSPARKWGWFLVIFVAWLGFSGVGLIAMGGPQAMLAALGVGAIWLLLFVYLLRTSKRERRGVETFLFAAGGFGFCADLESGQRDDNRLIDWADVDTVIVDRKGREWHRIRIVSGDASWLFDANTHLDVGIRCDEPTAAWIRDVLTERIAASRRRARPIATQA